MKIFVDTSAWLALNDKSDQFHSKAILKSAEIKKQKIELVTSDYVLDETFTIIRFRMSHKAAILFGDSIFNSNIVKIESIASENMFQAWEMFKKYKDKDFSFTDCTSFCLMKKRKIRKAFSFDKHFKQIGMEIF